VLTKPACVSLLHPCCRSINHIVSQSDVLMFLHKHVDELGPLSDVTLQQLGLATKPVVCVPAEMSTIKAFASMVVSCMCMLTWVGGGAGHRLFQVVGKQGACLVCYP
jgi:hypothetical protein